MNDTPSAAVALRRDGPAGPPAIGRHGGTAATALVAWLWMAGCGGDGRAPLVVYSPHGPELLEPVEREYERLHPDTDLKWLFMGSQEVYERVRAEAPNPQADVWYGGPSTILARGASEGLLAPYRPSWAEAIPASSRGAEDLFFASYRTAPVLAYNKDALAESEAPRDWDDLLEPRFKDQILLRDPLASGTMRTLFSMVLARSVAQTGHEDAGWAWLARFDAQTKEYVSTPALMLEKLTRREGLVTVWELTDMLWQQQRGRPLAYRFPTSGVPMIDDSLGLVKAAPHAEAAKVFIEWVGSLEGQRFAAEVAFRLPARTDLPRETLPAWAQEVLRQLVEAPMDGLLVAQKDREWMTRWDRTVRGVGESATR